MNLKVLLVLLTIFVINTPFGYWRANVKKYSLQWILAIHIPVIVGIFERIVSHISFSWVGFPIFIAVFFLGQFTGGRIYNYMKEIKHYPVSSCLLVDCYKGFLR
ncbi:MAG: hypothetical protein R2750_00965 [Bacteroidales bacterium]